MTPETLIRQAVEEVEWWQSRRWGDLGLRLRAEAMTALVGNLLAALTAERARADGLDRVLVIARKVRDDAEARAERAEQERDRAEMLRMEENARYTGTLLDFAAAQEALRADRDREAAARQEAESKLDTLRRQIGDNTALLWITAERDALRAQLTACQDDGAQERTQQ